MTRFRCPSDSVEATNGRSVTPQARAGPSDEPQIDDRATPEFRFSIPLTLPSTPKHHKHDQGKTRHMSVGPDDRVRVRGAIKKRKVRAKSAVHKMGFIFVGNLHPTVTQSDIAGAFSDVGDVVRVLIRHLGGQVSVYRAGKVNCASRIYATVEFRNPVIVRRALKVNGTEIKGMKLTVAKDVLELPEFSDTVEKYREQQEEAAKPKGFLKAGWEKLKLLTAERTEKIELEPESGNELPFLKMTFPRTVG